MSDLIKSVKEEIAKYSLIKPGDRIIVALSGGVDSVVLLDVLSKLRDELTSDLIVAHVNHGLRGKDSDRDAEFAKNMAKEYGFPFYGKKIDIAHLQTVLQGSPQEIAREERLQYLEQLAEKIEAHRIALGHNWDDQSETVLMRLIRGAGPTGLRGMGHSRGRFIRPLLDISRSEIAEYALTHKLKNVEDESNKSDAYLRNKIRHKLIPLLEKEYNPEIKSALIRLATILREEDRFLDRLCTDLFAKHAKVQSGEVVFEIGELLKLDSSLRARLIRMALRAVKHDLRRISHHHIDIIEELILSQAPQKQLDLPDDIKVYRVYSSLIIGLGESSYLSARGRPFEYKMMVPGSTFVKELGISVTSEVLQNKGYGRGFVFKPAVAFFDFDKLPPNLALRSVKPGDSFQPYGMTGSKKIADYFIELKIPSTQREMVPLMATENDIAWVVGYRVSEKYKIDRWSKKVLKVSIQ
ncbi:MAG: tRNA lysidine(34) synthetase TilS [Deltaproteobacteria bacterium RIFCSPHIGHO2_12_FULL_43_9]|nr:MAG: tRNA lysidine(34) synthetase TilS [Deltaproteobacteria bacterium RIFCSPHIGHO2_12_FULL_43_9]